MSRSSGNLIVAGLLLFAVGCGGGASSPDAAFKEFQAAVKAKDADRAWNVMAKEDRDKMDQDAKATSEKMKELDKAPPEQRKMAEEMMAKMLGLSAADLKSLDGKKMLAAAFKSPVLADKFNEITSATLENVKVDGDKATASVKSGGKTEPISFVKESGAWKVKMPKGP